MRQNHQNFIGTFFFFQVGKFERQVVQQSGFLPMGLVCVVQVLIFPQKNDFIMTVKEICLRRKSLKKQLGFFIFIFYNIVWELLSYSKIRACLCSTIESWLNPGSMENTQSTPPSNRKQFCTKSRKSSNTKHGTCFSVETFSAENHVHKRGL